MISGVFPNALGEINLVLFALRIFLVDHVFVYMDGFFEINRSRIRFYFV